MIEEGVTPPTPPVPAVPKAVTSFSVVIVSPDQLVLEVEATKLLVPGAVQELAILPNHTPLYSELIKGVVTVFLTNGKQKEVDIQSGILRVRSNQVSIILGFEKLK